LGIFPFTHIVYEPPGATVKLTAFAPGDKVQLPVVGEIPLVPDDPEVPDDPDEPDVPEVPAPVSSTTEITGPSDSPNWKLLPFTVSTFNLYVYVPAPGASTTLRAYGLFSFIALDSAWTTLPIGVESL
jgi:hypothetical protein